MIELWGHPTCKSCETAKELLGRTPLECKYVKIADDFEGEIPRIILEDGRHIIGMPAIKNYVQRLMKTMGVI